MEAQYYCLCYKSKLEKFLRAQIILTSHTYEELHGDGTCTTDIDKFITLKLYRYHHMYYMHCKWQLHNRYIKHPHKTCASLAAAFVFARVTTAIYEGREPGERSLGQTTSMVA